MSKNLTRKGLAFGALVALGASVFAGAPAYAADEIRFEANYTTDKTLAAPITETISLNASLAPGSTAANVSQLKYKIVTDGTYVLSVAGTSAASTVTDYNKVSVNGATAATASYTNNTTSVSGVTTGVFGASGTVKTTSYVTHAVTPSSTNANILTLGVNAVPDATTPTTGVAPTSASASETATVTAFLDSNNNGVLDSGETSKEITVKFVKFSEITTDTAITAPTQGDTSVTAVVKFTNVNMEALTNTEVGAYFTKGDGTDFGYSTAVTAIATSAGKVATYTTSANDLIAGDTFTTVGATASNTESGLVDVTDTASGTPTATSVVGTAISALSGTASTYSSLTTVSIKRASASLGNVLLKGNAVTYRGQTAVVYSSTSGGFKFVTGLVNALGKATAVKVQPLLVSTGTVASTNTVGTAATASVTTRVLGSLAGNTVKSTTAAAGTEGTAATANVAANKEKQVYFIAKDTATTPAAKAGQAIAVAVTTTATLSSTVTLTVNGTTYTSNAALPGATGVAKLALTSDSAGKVFVTYKTAGFSTQDVAFTATAENFTASVTATEAAQTWSQYIENNEGNTAVTTDGVAALVTVVVIDQFGGAPADGTFQISATETSNTQATPATSGTGSDTVANVVGGKATLSLVDNGTGLGNAVFALVRYSVAANGVVTTPVGVIQNSAVTTVPAFGTAGVTAAGALTQFTVAVKTAADIAAGEVVLKSDNTYATTLGKNTAETAYVLGAVRGGDTKAELTYSDFAAADARKVAVTEPSIKNLAGSTGTAANFYGSVFGVVNSASTATYGGVAIPSATVTASGTGLLFRASQDSANVWATDSITINANATGQFALYVYSHKAGTQTVTITSGTGSAKVEVNFEAAAELAASSVAVKVADGAAQFQSGRALDVVVTVTDKFGNPVAITTAYAAGGAAGDNAKVTIAQTGSGYLSLSGDQATGAAGTFTTKLITNAGDLGTSTITATVDFYDSTKTDLVATNSSEFGITDVTDISSAGKAIYVNTEFAKGKVVTVYINGVRMPVKAAEATDNAVERKYTQRKAGTYTVTVRVSGGVVASEKIVIK